MRRALHEGHRNAPRRRRLLAGDVPSPIDPPSGCRFHTRCPYVEERCKREEPRLQEVSPGQWVACHLRQLFEAMRRGRLSCPFRLEEEADAVYRLLNRYAEVPVSLADACLVRMAELYDGSPILTLDADFSVYRKNGRQVIELITPNA